MFNAYAYVAIGICAFIMGVLVSHLVISDVQQVKDHFTNEIQKLRTDVQKVLTSVGKRL